MFLRIDMLHYCVVNFFYKYGSEVEFMGSKIKIFLYFCLAIFIFIIFFGFYLFFISENDIVFDNPQFHGGGDKLKLDETMNCRYNLCFTSNNIDYSKKSIVYIKLRLDDLSSLNCFEGNKLDCPDVFEYQILDDVGQIISEEMYEFVFVETHLEQDEILKEFLVVFSKNLLDEEYFMHINSLRGDKSLKVFGSKKDNQTIVLKNYN